MRWDGLGGDFIRLEPDFTSLSIWDARRPLGQVKAGRFFRSVRIITHPNKPKYVIEKEVVERGNFGPV